MVKPMTYSFKVVKDGVNVYDYNQLLACTNKSTNGEIVVLRKSFESVNNLNNTTDNNVVCFGNYTDGKKLILHLMYIHLKQPIIKIILKLGTNL